MDDDALVVKELVELIHRLVRAVHQDSARLSKEFGLTGPQSLVLRALSMGGPMSSAGLSRALYVTPSNITGIIDRLEAKGLVQRIKPERDRRVTLITLTESGLGLSPLLPDPIERKLLAGLISLEPEEARRLSASVRQILDLIYARVEEGSPGPEQVVSLSNVKGSD